MNRSRSRVAACCCLAAASLVAGGTRGLAAAKLSENCISEAKTGSQGFLLHTIQSPYQAADTEVRILLPDRLQEDRQYPAVYVLPVEPATESRYGNGLMEVKRHDLHNKHQAVFVAPTFTQLPWYADHPTEPSVRQESYLLSVVVPFVDRQYPVLAASKGRLLVGFSKSGWGAWSLLLRHPDVFGRAAAWDAPMMMHQLGKYGTTGVLGTQENFERYRIADLLRSRAAALQSDKRLILTGYGNFRSHHQQVHDLMVTLAIPHDYQDGPHRKHIWESGWLPEAIELLFAQSQ